MSQASFWLYRQMTWKAQRDQLLHWQYNIAHIFLSLDVIYGCIRIFRFIKHSGITYTSISIWCPASRLLCFIPIRTGKLMLPSTSLPLTHAFGTYSRFSCTLWVAGAGMAREVCANALTRAREEKCMTAGNNFAINSKTSRTARPWYYKYQKSRTAYYMGKTGGCSLGWTRLDNYVHQFRIMRTGIYISDSTDPHGFIVTIDYIFFLAIVIAKTWLIVMILTSYVFSTVCSSQSHDR